VNVTVIVREYFGPGVYIDWRRRLA